jgi:hypothetical protein
MAGLLGNGFDDPQSAAIMALSAGLVNGNFGAGLLGANAAYREASNDKVKRGLLESQIAETLAQAEERKSRLELARQDQINQQRLLYGNPDAVSPGAFAPSADGFGPVMPQGAAPSGGGLIAQARAMGIPENVIQADIAFNHGKKLSEILDKRSTPNWQNVNGNLVDTNAQGFQGGMQAGLSAGNDGRVTAWQPDGRGGVVVGAPTGALETFGAYNRVGAASKPIKFFNPVTQREEWTSEATVTAPARPAPQQSQQPQQPPQQRMPAEPGMSGNFSGDPAPIMEAITQIRDPQERANAMAAFQEQARRTQGFSGGGGFPAGPSASEATAAAAERERAVGQAKADVVPTQQRQSAIDVNRQTLSVLDKALNHPGLDTATGLSGTIDPRNYIPGTDAKDFNVVMDQIKGKAFLQAYQSLKGGGQITEVEGKKATDAIARLNTAQSTPEFRSALMDLRDVVVSADARMSGGEKPSTEASQPAKAFSTMPMPSGAYAGKTLTDTQTGKRYKSNGAKWVEIQ